jgi:integrase
MTKAKHQSPGIIQLIDGRYQITARVRCGTRTVQRRVTLHCTKNAAMERFYALKREIKLGIPAKLGIGETGIRTLSDALSLYETRFFLPHSTSVFACIKKEMGERLIDASLAFYFDEYIKLLLKTGRAPGTINRRLAWSKAALNYCVRCGLIKQNPLLHIPRLKETPRDRVLSPTEEKTLLDACQEIAPHLKPLIAYALEVPVRKQEMVNLKRSDYDIVNNLIRIRCGESKGGAGTWKPVPPQLQSYFRSVPVESEYMFFRRSRRHGYQGVGDFKKSWYTVCKKAEIENLRFHDLRHHSATKLVLAGNSSQAVMVTAGWKSDMLRVYFHRDGAQVAKSVKFAPQILPPDSVAPTAVSV